MGLIQFNTDGNGSVLDGVALKNGTVDVNGTAGGVKFDADGDTYFEATTDDTLDMYVNGAKDFSLTSDTFNILTGSKIQGSGSCITPSAPIAAEQRISGSGAITITEYYSAVTSLGADAITLIDGVTIGQIKKIHLVVDGGSSTLTPVNLAGGSTITFTDAGDYAILQWGGTEWYPIELGNSVDGVTAPILA